MTVPNPITKCQGVVVRSVPTSFYLRIYIFTQHILLFPWCPILDRSGEGWVEGLSYLLRCSWKTFICCGKATIGIISSQWMPWWTISFTNRNRNPLDERGRSSVHTKGHHTPSFQHSYATPALRGVITRSKKEPSAVLEAVAPRAEPHPLGHQGIHPQRHFMLIKILHLYINVSSHLPEVKRN